MSYSFGTKSRQRLNTCHADLILIAETALALSPVDFSIVEGHRSKQRQKELFDKLPNEKAGELISSGAAGIL